MCLGLGLAPFRTVQLWSHVTLGSPSFASWNVFLEVTSGLVWSLEQVFLQPAVYQGCTHGVMRRSEEVCVLWSPLGKTGRNWKMIIGYLQVLSPDPRAMFKGLLQWSDDLPRAPCQVAVASHPSCPSAATCPPASCPTSVTYHLCLSACYSWVNMAALPLSPRLNYFKIPCWLFPTACHTHTCFPLNLLKISIFKIVTWNQAKYRIMHMLYDL
jgi:hypothetical protein